MNIKKYIMSVVLLLAAEVLWAAPAITNILLSADTVTIEWDAPTNRFIVEKSSSLLDWSNSIQCCASSTGSIQRAIAFDRQDENTMFYRVRSGLQVAPFPDPLLWANIKDLITDFSGPTNEIYDVDLIGITNLTVVNEPVTNITGLDQLHDLTFVGFHNTDVSDVRPLGSLTNVTLLYLYGNPVSDVPSLVGMAALEYLDLTATEVTNIAALTVLPNLEHLNIAGAPLDDVTSIAAFTNLTWLEIAHDSITNADLVSGLTSLTNLALGGEMYTGLADISGLSSLTNLQRLDIRYSAFSDLGPLASLTSLQELNIHGNPGVTDISVLSNMTNLVKLVAGGAQFSDLTALSGLTNLTSVYIPDNQVTDLSPLITNASLGGLGTGDSVTLSGNPLTPFAQTNQIPELTNTYNVTVSWP